MTTHISFPDWWPECPYPTDIFPMSMGEYAKIVPDDATRTALSGALGRFFWQVTTTSILFRYLAQQAEYPEPDWTQAPTLANWWVIHADGIAAWFVSKPHPYAAIWIDEFDEVGYTCAGSELPLGCDWRLTLRQRPSQQ